MPIHALSRHLTRTAATIAFLAPVFVTTAQAGELELEAAALVGLDAPAVLPDQPLVENLEEWAPALDRPSLNQPSLNQIASLTLPAALRVTPLDFDIRAVQAPDARPALLQARLSGAEQSELGQSALDGPIRPITLDEAAMEPAWANHVPRASATHRSFGSQIGSIKTELLILAAYFSAQSGKKLFRETTDFHFKSEGWFGKNTTNLGADKMLHAFDTYLIAEILHMRLHKNTHASEGDAVTAAAMASTLMALNEISDGIEPDSGYSLEDVAMNTAGAMFSVLRNTVPGMREKVSFKIEIVPNDDIYSYRGKKHYEQQRYMLSLKGRGFDALDNTPLRFLDLQLGYYASDFLNEDRAAGIVPKQHVFLGVGLNLGEILFGRKKTTSFSKGADLALDYLQLPYTSLRVDQRGDFSY